MATGPARQKDPGLPAHRQLLQARPRPAAVVSVKESIDMTTPIERVLATMLASFAEFEASSIFSRVTAARARIVEAGRLRGGPAP